MIDRDPRPTNSEFPLELKMQCEQRANELAEKIPLPSTLIEALKPDSFLPHLTGYQPYDKAYIDGVPQALSDFSQHFLEKYQEMERYVNTSSQITTALQLMKRTGKFVNELADDWVMSARSFARTALTCRFLLNATLGCDSINYHPEGQPFWDYDITSFIKTSDLELADEDGKIHESKIAAQLTEQGKRNISSEKLNARFEHAMALYQLTIADVILWQTVGLFGPGKKKQQKSLAIFEKWKQLSSEDDIYGKIDLIAELAANTERFAQSEPDTKRKQVYSNLKEGNRQTLLGLEVMLDFYTNVYQTLGYELPPPLAHREQNKEKQIVEASSETAADDAQAEAVQLPTEELEELIGQLSIRVNEFNQVWSLSGKQRKKRGLSNLEGEFVRGSEALPGTTKERAAELVDILAQLEALGKLEEGRDQFASYLERQTDLQAEIAELLTLIDEVTQSKLETRGLILRDIAGHVEYIKENWLTIKQLILGSWPDYAGAVAAHTIEQLLFVSPAPEKVDQEPEKPPVTTVGSLIVYGYIDEVVFPGRRGESEVEEYVKKTLRESGASERQMRDLQWQRILDLDTVKELFGGKLYKTKPKERFLGTYAPYFVVIFEYNGSRYAVAESPIFGNATYVVAEKHAAATWLEILKTELRRDAKEFGAIDIKHTTDAPYGDGHTQKIYETVVELDERPI